MENRDHRQGGTLPGGIERVQSIASARQFLELLRRFPAEPAFYVDFAEFLLGKHRAGLAAKSYARAAALYLTAGEALKSLGARLLSWELVAPDVSETRDAYLQLRNSGWGRGAASSFLSELPYREWVTVVSAMRVVRLPAGHMIQKFGSVEEHLFFIVSGSAQSTRFLSLEAGGASRPAEEVTLGCDDYFGSVYPLERESISASSVKSLTPVAVIRIPKTSLVDVCRRHPGVTLALERLFRSPGMQSSPDLLICVCRSSSSVAALVQIARYDFLMWLLRESSLPEPSMTTRPFSRT